MLCQSFVALMPLTPADYPELRPALIDLLVKHWPSIKQQHGIDGLRALAAEAKRPLGEDVLWELVGRLVG